MKWSLMVLIRDSQQVLGMRFEEMVAAKEQAAKLTGDGVDMVELGPDADNSVAWVDPTRVQAVLVAPDLSGSQIAVPQIRPRR